MKTTDTASDQPPIRRYPEAPRRRTLTVRPKTSRYCAWRSIQRAETRVAGLTMAAAASNRSSI